MKVLFLFFFLLLTACTTPQQTLIPIPIKQIAPQIPLEPYLATDSLNKNSSPQDVIRAYVATKLALQNWGDSLKILLESYTYPN